MMAMHFPGWQTPVMPGRGDGLISGNAPFYRCYFCADGRQVSVGALEVAFFKALWTTLKLGDIPDHMDMATWPFIEQTLDRVFSSQPRVHWEAVFAGTDACVAPVLSPDEVWREPQNRYRHPDSSHSSVPAIPRFSRTASFSSTLDRSDRSREVLASVGMTDDEIAAAVPSDPASAVEGLSWPPVFRNSPLTSKGQ
jgi:alpha-methylacyl-CoA racemase